MVLSAQQRAQAKEYLAKAYEAKPEQVSSSYFYALLLHEDGENDKAREVMKVLEKIPVSGILQISKEEVAALRKKIG